MSDYSYPEKQLTTSHPEPAAGSVILDAEGIRWVSKHIPQADDALWFAPDLPGHAPKAWSELGGPNDQLQLVFEAES